METLRAERDRIKKQLYAEYGDRIHAMMQEESKTIRTTPAEERERKLQAMLSDRTPFRQEVLAAQSESLRRLVEEARGESDRGIDVGSRLDMLLSLQKQAVDARAATTHAPPAKEDTEPKPL